MYCSKRGLPDGRSFDDKDGNTRIECRCKWWLNPENLTMEQYLFHAPKVVWNLKLSSEYFSLGYDPEAPPIFFGHYWLDDDKEPV